MAETLTLNAVRKALDSGAAAFRCRRRLQPAGGVGDKVFPPTFAGAVYAEEKRRIPGHDEPVPCVLLDSVQSQANRMELALQDAVDSGHLQLPVLEVDFSEHGPTGDLAADQAAGRLIDAIGKVTSLQVPHRLSDAILRDSELDGVLFRQSDLGKALNTLSVTNATPLFELCPTALIFGMWDSTGPKGGLGVKFERAVVSEVVAINAQVGDLVRGVRRDPLDIRAAIKVVKPAEGPWSVAAADAKKAVSPSEINHSNVPFPKDRGGKRDSNKYSGITFDYSEQVTTLSLICLRRLRFPLAGRPQAPEAETAARTILAALGLCAATLAFESGLALRSRCLLWPEEAMEWDLLTSPGVAPTKFSLTRASGISLLNDAVSAGREQGLPWRTTVVTLKPSAALLELVRRSQLLATTEGTAEGD